MFGISTVVYLRVKVRSTAKAHRSLGDLVARGTRSAVHAYGRDAVIKVPDRATPEDWIIAEARYADAVRAAGAPAPRLLDVRQVRGRAASVWEWVRGPSMWQEILGAPTRAASYGRLLADLQLELFALVPPVVLPSQRDRLVNKIRRCALAIDPALGEALDALPAPSRPLRVCHGDLHPGNIILSADGPVVIDWFDASRGDRAGEIARSRLLLRAGADAALPSHLPGATRPLLAALADGYLGRIHVRLEVTADELRRWEAVEVVAQMAEHVPQAAVRAG
jgi:aminoglycoside phosphotransferase (APT) family kinase protein